MFVVFIYILYLFFGLLKKFLKNTPSKILYSYFWSLLQLSVSFYKLLTDIATVYYLATDLATILTK